MAWIAALPMYDWPEARDETDALWASLRQRLLAQDIDAPHLLTRRNGDLPPVPGGIRAPDGQVIAADPADLDPDGFDLPVLWRHPNLLIASTCWGPLEFGLGNHVAVVGQSRYDGVAGGHGADYSSAIIARKADGLPMMAPPASGEALLPLDFLRDRRLAFNETTSLSGYLSLTRDLQALGESPALFAERIATGAHRASILAVAEGRADVAAIDCRSWMLAQRHEPAADALQAIGWTARRRGLPFIRALGLAASFHL